ncbi:MAG TPA: TM0106 family RecB-like putative nuclease [Edaphobacter sp.]|nr:TM0106 family RecB-like putative nuclease [Edaphobacter sp.]
MKNVFDEVLFSASDLSNHLACSHATSLDFEVARGHRESPKWHSPDLWILQERGRLHEEAYIRHLRDQGLSVRDLRVTAADQMAAEATRISMKTGVDVIVQATFAMGRWYGRADVLRRVETASSLGTWSYEVYDCKLSTETKAGTILQLSLYSEMVGAVQGLIPDSMYVVPPSDTFTAERYRILDYAAYYRSIKVSLERAVNLEAIPTATYPEPVEHCDVCAWFSNCDVHRRRDDHLSLVAGLSKLHRKQLNVWNIQALADLAVMPIPLQQRPKYSSAESLIRVREQARIQVDGRDHNKPIHELLTVCEDHGFCGLPEPSRGDIFFDLEGDPYVGKTGREYLFGFTCRDENGEPAYHVRWSLTADEERRTFEWFVDEVMDRWRTDPDLHIYHFTAYEPSALKRLMGRYATRESQIDQLLRAGIFIDLHTIVKRSLRASVETYSLKALEAFHGYIRTTPLEHARTAMRAMQHGLELGVVDLVNAAAREVVVGYNADDCFSTQSLRDWLERQRQVLVDLGAVIPRPKRHIEGVLETIDASQSRSEQLILELLRGVPTDPEMRTGEQAGLQLLADLLDWHRRESKVAWWEFFRLRDLTEDELFDEKAAVSGLRFVTRLTMARGVPTDRYEFDRQETEVRTGDKLCHKDEKIGETIAIDLAARTVDIKKTRKTADTHPSSVFVDCTPINTQILADSLIRLAECVTFDGIDAPGPLRAARDLLLRRRPRIREGTGPLCCENETTLVAAKRLVGMLQESVLPIQGPPGAGKTFTGASMIVELVKQGKRVGVTATSHAVVRNLLIAVVKVAAQENMHDLKCLQRVPEIPAISVPGVDTTTDNTEGRLALRGSYHILGGTAWLWSSKDFKEAVDVLFVDEAGQMALANVLAASQSAKSVVLLGDPQQLEQPLKGTHPDGAEASALEHLLDGEKTISLDRGLFLEETWRLHPSVCAFTSEVFYESRLRSHAGLESQRILGHPWLGEAGLWFLPVDHGGNRNSSTEEVEKIAELVDGLLKPSVSWEDGKAGRRDLRVDDILIVAPYNAQVADLAERLPAGIRIGTVDKFQGQEAPIVIYSLTTSSQEDAPRGMEFLYSLNRLNVATSRAMGMVIVLGSPHLLKPDCRSPRQMQLANALCRYVELAGTP